MKSAQFIIFFVYFFSMALFSQKNINEKQLFESDFEDSISFYTNEFKNLMIADSGKALPMYIAYRHYQELHDVTIKIKGKRIKTTMKAVPQAVFLFKKPENRKYKIYYNTKPRRINNALYDSLSFNAKIGVTGHEYSHIADYKEMKNRELVKYGISYLFQKQRAKIEKRTDSLTIAHGLGWQLYDFSNYILNEAEIPEEYRKYKKKNYYTPRRIKRIINRDNNEYRLD